MTLGDRKADLCTLVQKASELEWATIPAYLTALLSIKQGTNRVAATLIRSVMMEEMLHMVMVGNLLSSIGSKVHFGSDNIPTYPLRLKFQGQTFKDRNFDISLATFSAATIQTFLKIEMPASLLPQHMALFELREIDVPGITIGDFYNRVIHDLESLCADFSEREVFSGGSQRQIGEQYYWSGAGKPVVITDLASAKKALDVVIRQGEGIGASIEDDDEHYFDQLDGIAHFFRFSEISAGRFYRPGDKPGDPPSGDKFDVDYSAVYPIKANPKQSDYAPGSKLATLNESFNRRYSIMLSQLETAFGGTPYVLYDAINDGMRAMTSVALEMMDTPLENDPSGRTGAPSFEWVAPPV